MEIPLSFFLFLKFYLINIFSFILHTNHSFLPLLSCPGLPSTSFPSTPFRKGQVSHGLEQSMAHQVEAASGTSPIIKVREGNPVWGLSSQQPAQVPGTGPSPTARSPTNRYTTVTHMQKT